MKTWICRNCNSENTMNMNFCPVCHQPQLQNTAFAPPPLPAGSEQRTVDPDFLFQSAPAAEAPPERREPARRSSDPDFLFQTPPINHPAAPPAETAKPQPSETQPDAQWDDVTRMLGTEETEQETPAASRKSADIPVFQAAVSKDTPWQLNPADFAGAAQTTPTPPVQPAAQPTVQPAIQPEHHTSAPPPPVAPRTEQKPVSRTAPAAQNPAYRQAAARNQKNDDKDMKMRKILIAANAALLIANIVGLILWLK